MRGKEPVGVPICVEPRITPAYAGKSLSSCPVRRFRGDHPRICGEKFPSLCKTMLPRGSPPHMRGKARQCNQWLQQPRITPAYAGKSRWFLRSLRPTRDHPRICGEKRVKDGFQGGSLGSPPHMRGKDERHEKPVFCHGITPAYAGKSAFPDVYTALIEDHPRICGEKRRKGGSYVPWRGSPPHMRGKELFKQPVQFFHRITPAYAGKRFGESMIGNIKEDHPRICGEKTKKIP